MNPLSLYFNSVANSINAKYELAGQTFHNPDIGSNREDILVDFINNHCPHQLRAYVGGTILGFKQPASKQMDIIVANDI